MAQISIPLSIRMAVPTREMLEAQARAEQRTMTEIIDAAIRQYVAERSGGQEVDAAE